MKIVLLAIFSLTSAFAAYAQEGGYAKASVTIVTPINISHITDLSFGNVVGAGASAITTVISPATTNSSAGNVALPAAKGNGSSPASFTVFGEPNYTYSITLPSSVSVYSNTHNMTVSNFTSFPSGTGLLIGGSQVVNVGATLAVSATQIPDAHKSAALFPVMVNYY